MVAMVLPLALLGAAVAQLQVDQAADWLMASVPKVCSLPTPPHPPAVPHPGLWRCGPPV